MVAYVSRLLGFNVRTDTFTTPAPETVHVPGYGFVVNDKSGNTVQIPGYGFMVMN